MDIPPQPWAFENQCPNNVTACHAAVLDAEGRAIFDMLNADVSLYQIDTEVDEDGAHHTVSGPAVDAVRLASFAPALLKALKRAVIALNAIPCFDTGLPIENPKPFEVAMKRGLSSYKLLPKLECIIRNAEGELR